MRPRPSLRQRWHGARGQSTAFVVVMLWVLILFVALVANVGQAVNRRIALQTVADAGAWTGATRMAEGLNYIAWANGLIQEAWAYATIEWDIAAGLTLYACEPFDGINGAYNAQAGSMFAAISAIEFGYGGLNGGTDAGPNGQARFVSEYNARDLFPGEILGYSETDNNLGAVMNPFPRDPAMLMGILPIDDGDEPNSEPDAAPAVIPQALGPGYESSKTVFCHQACGPFRCPAVRNYSFMPWYKKAVPGSRYFSWVATAPATRSLVFDWFFGPLGVPEMKAIGVARAVGGDIEKGRPKYVAEMVPASRVLFGGVSDPYNDWTATRQVTH